ncbi:MAG: hypothetical protein GY795_48700 [Desulfobacterales bacterium]|nr:hypothetical protein [Desulfobacterales bacterium]
MQFFKFCFTGWNYQRCIESLGEQIRWMREHVGKVLQHSSESGDKINISADGDVAFAKNRGKARIQTS